MLHAPSTLGTKGERFYSLVEAINRAYILPKRQSIESSIQEQKCFSTTQHPALERPHPAPPKSSPRRLSCILGAARCPSSLAAREIRTQNRRLSIADPFYITWGSFYVGSGLVSKDFVSCPDSRFSTGPPWSLICPCHIWSRSPRKVYKQAGQPCIALTQRMELFFQIFILDNILIFITLFNVFSYFEIDNLPSYVLSWMSFVTLLVFIVAVPYIEYYEGGDLIAVSYLCSSSIVYNFYLRSEGKSSEYCLIDVHSLNIAPVSSKPDGSKVPGCIS